MELDDKPMRNTNIKRGSGWINGNSSNSIIEQKTREASLGGHKKRPSSVSSSSGGA